MKNKVNGTSSDNKVFRICNFHFFVDLFIVKKCGKICKRQIFFFLIVLQYLGWPWEPIQDRSAESE